MSLVIVTKPTAIALTLAEAKDHLEVPTADTDDDTLITRIIQSVTEMAQTRTNRQLMPATYRYRIARFSRIIRLPLPPLIGVDSVKYYDDDGNEQTVDAASYRVDTDSEPGRIELLPGYCWPTPRTTEKPIAIQFQCGYADSGQSPAVPNDNVPEGIKSWMQLQAGNLYEHETEYLQGLPVQPLGFVDQYIESFMIPELY